jgi:hypothetical protein
LRIYRVSRELGEWPTFSDDEVLDWMVKEAVIMAGQIDEMERDKAAEKAAERDAWRKEGLTREKAMTALPREE